MNSQMALVTKVLPIGFGLFSLQFPAGLVLYYFVSNLWRLGQQELIMRKITRPGLAAHAAASGAIDVKSSEKNKAAACPTETKPAGGLRKLFQLPAPSTVDASVDVEANGSGAVPEPAPSPPASRSGTPPPRSGQARAGKPRGTPSTAGGQRRKNNKRRKKR